MSEFDAFESAGNQPPAETDPAAEFLAREQSQMAELGDDSLVMGQGQAEPQGDMLGGESLMGSNIPTAGGDDLMAAFGAPAATTTEAAPVTEAVDQSSPVEGLVDESSQPNPAAPIDDVLAQFDGPAQQASDSGADMMGDMMGDSGMGYMGDTMGDMGDTMGGDMGGFGEAQEGQDVFSAIAQVDQQRAEPEKIRLWRIEHEERLTKKDAEEQTKMEEWRQIARQELEDWYKHRDEQLEKAKVSNREGEAAFIKERDETLPGQTWEKICRVCEFNPKNNKSTKDNSRMRSILLQLKQTPLVR